MDDWAELEKTLGEMTAAGDVEVHEDGQWLAELSGLRCELRRKGELSLLHLWSDDRSLVRRVVGVAERSPQHVVFEVQRFGRSRPARLEFILASAPRRRGRVSIEKFRARFTRLLEENYPDARIESLSVAQDLERSFSGLYVRGVLAEGSSSWALLAAPPNASAAALDGMLTFGLLWLDWTRDHAARRAVEGLRLFASAGAARVLRHRTQALSSSVRVQLFEIREGDSRIRPLDEADLGNLESVLTPRREIERTLAAAAADIDRVRALEPRAAENIAVEVRSGAGLNSSEVALRFRGLEFAHWIGGQMTFGDTRGDRRISTDKSVTKLLQDLDLHRDPLAHETNHAFYRAAPERWLEAMVLRDPTQLDAQLDARFFYSQVPARTAGNWGVIDLLGVTRQKRLAVIELKAGEDIQLPLQAVDYWLRVCRHLRDGDFQRHGYFGGVELDPRPPLLWLVAPALRFHPAADRILKYLSPEIHVTRIGLNENWRRGLRVTFRQ